MAVPGQPEQDRLAQAFLAAPQRLVDGGPDRVRGLRRGQDSLCPGELNAGIETSDLRYRDRLDELLLYRAADQRPDAVRPQSARTHRRRDEGVPQGVHPEQRAEPTGVTVIVCDATPGERRAGRRL